MIKNKLLEKQILYYHFILQELFQSAQHIHMKKKREGSGNQIQIRNSD